MSSLKVYIVNTLDESFAQNREALAHSLSPYRTAKLERLAASRAQDNLSRRRADNYELCLAAGLVTDIGLSAYGLREKDMKYGTAANGKPVFLNHPEIHFNISHAGHFAVAAFSDDYELGIDIESSLRISNRIIYSFFSEGERELILACPDDYSRRLMFGRIWTMHEAFVKSTGLGMAVPRNSYEAVTKDGRLAIRQDLCEGEFGAYEMNPIEDYCVSVVAARNINIESQARG